MFFKLAMRNSRRSRKENGLFFASLVVSIVAFYIILALSHQDVMIFLRSLESDAVNSLLQIARCSMYFHWSCCSFLYTMQANTSSNDGGTNLECI